MFPLKNLLYFLLHQLQIRSVDLCDKSLFLVVSDAGIHPVYYESNKYLKDNY